MMASLSLRYLLINPASSLDLPGDPDVLSGLRIKHSDMCDLQQSGQKDQSLDLKVRLLCDLLPLNPDKAQLGES